MALKSTPQPLQDFIAEWKKKEEEDKRSLMDSLPVPIQNVKINHRRYESRIHGPLSLVPEFLDHIVSTYPDHHYIMLERDCRPLQRMMNILYPEKDVQMVWVNREVLPKRVRYYAAETYKDMQKHISISIRRRDSTLLHQYLDQEIDTEKETLLIDTGYWGRCIGYIKSYTRMNCDLQLMFGPPNSPSFICEETENYNAMIIEDNVEQGIKFDRLQRNGELIEVQSYPNPDPYHRIKFQTDQIAIEMLAHLHKGELSPLKVEAIICKYVQE